MSRRAGDNRKTLHFPLGHCCDVVCTKIRIGVREREGAVRATESGDEVVIRSGKAFFSEETGDSGAKKNLPLVAVRVLEERGVPTCEINRTPRQAGEEGC